MYRRALRITKRHPVSGEQRFAVWGGGGVRLQRRQEGEGGGDNTVKDPGPLAGLLLHLPMAGLELLAYTPSPRPRVALLYPPRPLPLHLAWRAEGGCIKAVWSGGGLAHRGYGVAVQCRSVESKCRSAAQSCGSDSRDGVVGQTCVVAAQSRGKELRNTTSA